MIVKVCGVTRLDDAMCAMECGASAIGFVFWPDSPRAMTPELAAEISHAMPAGTLRVGVFVDPDPTLVATLVRTVGLDLVQLHGSEPVSPFRAAGVRLVKAVSLHGPEDVAAARRLPHDVTPLVDARDGQRHGGTGKLANWTLAAELGRERPIWLAGGLRAENVRAAIRLVKPAGLDVSSGVESAPGIKDRARLEAFFEAVRAEEREAS